MTGVKTLVDEERPVAGVAKEKAADDDAANAGCDTELVGCELKEKLEAGAVKDGAGVVVAVLGNAGVTAVEV